MARGGKRMGSGRPPGAIGGKRLNADLRIAIAVDVEKRWNAACQRAIDAAIHALPYRDDIKKLHQEAKEVEVGERAIWLRSSRGGDYIEDIEGYLELASEATGHEGVKRLWHVVPTRPAGGKEKIFREVAADWTAKLRPVRVSSFKVTPRMVRSCYEELKRRLDEADE